MASNLCEMPLDELFGQPRVNADPLNDAVAELLQRTNTLLRSSTGGDRTPSDNGRSDRSSLRPALNSRGLASIASIHSSTYLENGEPVLDSASRVRGSLEAASRKLTAPMRASGSGKPQSSVASARAAELCSETQTPRLTDKLSRPPPSITLTEPASANLDPSGPTSLNYSLPGGSKDGTRAYNSFGGLQEMVSMIDGASALVNPPRPATASGSRTSFASGPFTGVSNRGLILGAGAEARPPPARMISPSRLGSPAMSPRSPLRRGSVVAVSAGMSSSKLSRRAQLQALLSKELGQPQDVMKFKEEIDSPMQPIPSVMQLTVSLQKQFENVNRKLESWKLIESTTTERFTAAMDAALETVFSRIQLSWPSVLPVGIPDSSAGVPSSSTHDYVWSSTQGKARRPEKYDKDMEHSPQRGHRCPYTRQDTADGTDDPADESPSSWTSQRYAWDEELSTTTDADEDVSRDSMRQARSRGRPKTGGAALGQRGDSRREAVQGGLDHRHRSADPTPSSRTDPEVKSWYPRQTADMPTGAWQQPASAPWHVGPSGAYIAATAHPSASMHQHAAAAAVAAAPAAMGPALHVPNASALFGLTHPPFTPSSAAYLPTSVPRYPTLFAAPHGAGVPFSGQHYSTTAVAAPGIRGSSAGAEPAYVRQSDNIEWKLGADAYGTFPFVSEAQFPASGAPQKETYGSQSAGGAPNHGFVMYKPQQGKNSPAASCMTHIPASSRSGAATTAAMESCATVTTAHMYSPWPVHSAAQFSSHGTQETNLGASGGIQMGISTPEMHNKMFYFPSKPAAYGYPPILPSSLHAMAFSGLTDLIGGSVVPGGPQMEAGHSITYGPTGPTVTGQERLAANQFMRYPGH